MEPRCGTWDECIRGRASTAPDAWRVGLVCLRCAPARPPGVARTGRRSTSGPPPGRGAPSGGGTLPAWGAAAAAATPPGTAAREAVPATLMAGIGRKIPCLKLI